jgi:TetR/AcrR family transcriptional repressor of mexJK operon
MVNLTEQAVIAPAFATRERIIEVAIRRFGHFGFDKTTMTEIALDASISKQALWNYFPDKKVLITAVIEKVIGEYIRILEAAFIQSKDVYHALQQLLEARRHLYTKYTMLVSQLVDPQTLVWNKTLIEAKDNLKEKEEHLLRELLSKGVVSEELKQLDAEKTSTLILDVFTSMLIHAFDWNGMTDTNTCELLYKKQKDLLMLIYNGMSAS